MLNSLFPRAALASLLVMAALSSVQAQVVVQEPWVRATTAGQTVTGAFMQLTAGKAARVLSVSSPLAASAEIHEMKMDGGVMQMRALDALPLPAGQAVALKPGSYHLMLMGLKAPIKAGDTVPLQLLIEGDDRQRQTLDVKATARAAGPMAH